MNFIIVLFWTFFGPAIFDLIIDPLPSYGLTSDSIKFLDPESSSSLDIGVDTLVPLPLEPPPNLDSFCLFTSYNKSW